MKAWLTAAVVAALASVLTAAQAQEGQVPASDARQFLSPEPLQPRTVQTQSFRRQAEQPAQREAEQPPPPPVRKQATRKRSRPAALSQPARRASRASLRGRAISEYAQARAQARRAVLREVTMVPSEPQRVQLSAGFDQYITRMNIW